MSEATVPKPIKEITRIVTFEIPVTYCEDDFEDEMREMPGLTLETIVAGYTTQDFAEMAWDQLHDVEVSTLIDLGMVKVDGVLVESTSA
jgi:hypothetical protein